MGELRIAYIIVEVPWPPDKGGKMCFLNHITEISQAQGVSSSLVLLDADGDRAAQAGHFREMGLETEVFPRSLPHVSEGFSAGVRAFASFLTSPEPRICRVRKSDEAIAHVRKLVERGLDAIVFEHISGMEMIPPEVFGRIPVVFVTHNVERRVALDQFRSEGVLSPLRLFFLGEYLKTVLYEKRLMKRVSAVISLSECDAQWYSATYGGARIVLTDEPIPGREQLWKGSESGGRLLFIGSHRYFPNLDALRWLAGRFMPELGKLAPEAVLTICGLSEQEARRLGIARRGIEYLGFVDEKALPGLHCSCDLYLCPIRLGSGIKMKILDAMSYHMPVAAVPQSLAGIGAGGPLACLDFDDPQASAERVAGLLRDRSALQAMSDRTRDALVEYRRARRDFAGAVREALEPHPGVTGLCPAAGAGYLRKTREV